MPTISCINDYRPSRGGYCLKCGRVLPRLPDISTQDERELLNLIADGRTVEAIRFFQGRLGLKLADSKSAVEHMYG